MTQLIAFDVADYLDTPEIIATYLTEAFEADEAHAVLFAISDVARARGLTAIAEEAGLSNETLYRSLGSDRTPEFGKVFTVLRALGVELVARPQKNAGA